MYLAWEAMSAFIPDLFIGGSHRSFPGLINGVDKGWDWQLYRYHGLRFFVPCRLLAWKRSCRRLCTLPNNIHRHAPTGADTYGIAYELERRIIFEPPQFCETIVCAFPAFSSFAMTFWHWLPIATIAYSCTNTRMPSGALAS
jgi:hypothetical protein